MVSVPCAVCGGRDTLVHAQGYDYEYATASNLFTFCACKSCGHLYLNPRPSIDQLGIIYPSASYYAFSENQSGNSLVAYFRKIWESRKVKDFQNLVGEGSKKILDVGCGEGRFLALLKEYGDPQWELVGLDFDEKAIQLCRQRGFRCLQGRIEDLPSHEKFDVIIMFQLIEHVDNPREVIRSMRSVLNSGGFIILETPNPRGLDYQLFTKKYWSHYHFPRHWHLFTADILNKVVLECGFEKIQNTALLSPASWIISIHNRLLGENQPKALIDFFNFRNPILLGFFVIVDLIRKTFGFPTSNQRLTARAPL